MGKGAALSRIGSLALAAAALVLGLTLATGACTLTTSLGDLSGGSGTVDAGRQEGGTLEGGVEGGVDAGSDGASTSLPTSCFDLKKKSPTQPDGYYRIDADGTGPRPTLDVYCDMTTAGGGWTLVARSVGEARTDFGWSVATGKANDDRSPYSLGVIASGLVFDAILVGERGSGKALAGSAYTMSFSSDDVAASTRTPHAELPATVVGNCSPPNGPTMLRFVGYTLRKENYFFRDNDSEADPNNYSRGLFSNGLAAEFDDCSRGGNLNGEQGEIFVR